MEDARFTKQAILQSWEKKLLTADPHWKLEHCFLSGMAGEGGGQILRKKLLECLPSVDNNTSIQETLQQLTTLMSSTLWKFTSEQQQNILQAGVDLVKNLSQGVSPGGVKDGDAFISEVTQRLQYFCIWKGNDPATNMPTTYYGKEAARYMMADLLGKDKNAGLADIEKVATFRWLLSRDDEESLKGLLDKVVKTRLPAKASSSRSGKKALPEVEATARMFG